MKRMLAILVAVALTGCAAQQQSDYANRFTKPGVSAEQAEKDRADCVYETAKAGATQADLVQMTYKEVFVIAACMRHRGYQQTK